MKQGTQSTCAAIPWPGSYSLTTIWSNSSRISPALWPAGMKHFVWAKGETVIQFHGAGPWSLQYVNPDDDPRKAKQSKP